MWVKSLRFRLVAAAAVWVFLGFAGAFFELSTMFREHETDLFFEELFVHVEELERLTTDRPDGAVELRSIFSDPRYDAVGSGYYWEVRDNGVVRLKSASLGEGVIAPVAHHPAGNERPRLETTGPTGDILITVAKITKPGGVTRTFTIGTDKRELETLVSKFNTSLLHSLVVLGAAMIVAATAIVVVGLAPFRRLTHALRDVRGGVTPTLKGQFPTEVAGLVNELNGLIEGGTRSVEYARAQAGALAHALKTPLAIVLDEAYEIEKKGEASSAELIAAQCQNMQRHIDLHIARARASAMSRLPGLKSDVGEVTKDVVNALQRLHARSGVTAELELDAGVHAMIDRQDLSEILANLVDNAFKHAKRKIVVSSSLLPDGVLAIKVADDGEGLPAEALEAVFEPGVRWDQRRPGTGLGLAIVRDLVALYGGRVQLSGSLLGGLCATVILSAQRA